MWSHGNSYNKWHCISLEVDIICTFIHKSQQQHLLMIVIPNYATVCSSAHTYGCRGSRENKIEFGYESQIRALALLLFLSLPDAVSQGQELVEAFHHRL